MSSLVITIDAATDIVMSASPTSPTNLGITAYAEPTPIASNTFAPSSRYLMGSGTALAWTYEDLLLNFTVAPLLASTESAARGLITDLRTAVARLSYNVTINVNGAGNEVWRTNGAGSVTPASARDAVNMRTFKTEWNVSIPCYPVRVS